MTNTVDCPQCRDGNLDGGVCQSCGLDMVQVCENIEARGRTLSDIASQVKPVLKGQQA
jgi:hypothetical protein